jgi:cytochrome c biogenesis protein CcmG/thiol:disulfide interchange protein DsbE
MRASHIGPAVGRAKPLKLVLLALLLVSSALVAACTGSESAPPEGVNEGNRARDFTLENLAGDDVSLSALRGQVVLVNFWATWCAPCRAEIPGFEQVYQTYKDSGFVVLGVNLQESRDQVEPFVDAMDVTYPILLDQSGDVTQVYRTLGLPMSILVTPEGLVHTRHVGFLSDSTLENYLRELLPEP